MQSRPASEQSAKPGFILLPSPGIQIQEEKLQVTLDMKSASVHAILVGIARQAQLDLSFDNRCAYLAT